MRVGAALVVALLAAGVQAAPSAPVDIRFGRHPNFWRIALEWAEPAPANVATRPGEVVVAPLAADAADAERVARRLDAVVRHVAVEGDALRLFLRDGVRARTVPGLDARVVAVDFERAPPAAAASEPAGAIVPRRRPRPSSAPAQVKPFPIAVSGSSAPNEAAGEAARDVTTTDAGSRTEDASRASLPPLPRAPLRPPTPAAEPAAERDGERDAATRVRLPPIPAVEDEPPGGAQAPAAASPATAAPPIALNGPLTPPPTPQRGAHGVPSGAGGAPAPGAAVAEATLPPRLRIVAEADGVAFDFPAPVKAAAWRRGDEVWLVFAPVPADLALPAASPAGLVRVEHDRALVWRVAVPADAPRRLVADGATWRLEPGAPAPDAAAPAADHDDAAIAFDDPWLGVTWRVVPQGPDGGRTAASRRHGPRSWLPTLHGGRFRDLRAGTAAIDDAGAEPPGALAAPLPRPELGPLIGLAGPSLPLDAAADRRRALEVSLFADPAPVRRLELARFLLGRGQARDALAVLDAAAAPAADAAAAARLAVLEGVAATLAGRLERAASLLPAVDDEADAEVWLWDGMLAAAGADWSRAGEAFARSGQVWRRYPLPLRRRVAGRAAEAALELDAPQVAQAVLHQVDTATLDARVDGELALLEARTLAAVGDAAAARERLRRLERAENPASIRRAARFARARLDHAAGELDDAGARELLEPDAPGWTGRDAAAAFWRFLAARRAATGAGRDAFAAWRRAGIDRLDDRQETVLDALIAGEAPFSDALADAVVVLERHLDALPPGLERAERLEQLATRVAAETDALHVADRLYRRALAEPVPHAVTAELRAALAELRLDRQLPRAALEALAPLDDAAAERVEELRRRARAHLEGRPAPGEAVTSAPEPDDDPAAADLEATLQAVDDALAESRELLDREAGDGGGGDRDAGGGS